MPFLLHSQNVVTQLSNADGLSNNSVNCFLEDSEHALWIGTWEGLNVYNGRNFKNYSYNKKDIGSISNNVIWQIIEQNDSIMWVSTDYGINQWKRSTQKFTPYFLGTEGHAPKQDRAYQIGITSQKNIICYVKERGLFYFDEQQQEFIRLKNKLPNNIKKFVIDNENRLVFLTEEGKLYLYFFAFDKSKPLLSFIKIIEHPGAISTIYLTDESFIADSKRSITLFSNYIPQRTINLPREKNVSQIIQQNNLLFISFIEGECMKYNLEDGSEEKLSNLPEKISIFTIYNSSQDVLWIGTDGQGILKVYKYKSPFHTIKTNNPTRCFCEEDNGNILAGTKGEGILLIDKQNGKAESYLTIADGLISNSVYAMRKNMSGDIFIGTEGEGINYMMRNDKRIKKLNMPDSTSEETGPLFSLMFRTARGCSCLKSSPYAARSSTTARMIFRPPAVEPVQPPRSVSKRMKASAREGQFT